MPAPARQGYRPDLAYRFAKNPDIQRISWVVTLTKWIPREPDLKERALRILRFCAALHRTGAAGYQGVECDMDLFHQAVSRFAGRCSRATFYRGLADLVESGDLERVPGNRIGRPRRIGPDSYVRDRVAAYVFTRQARALWSEKISVSRCDTSDLMSDQLPVTDPGAGTPLGSSSCARGVSGGRRGDLVAVSAIADASTAAPVGRCVVSSPNASDVLHGLATLAQADEGGEHDACQVATRLSGDASTRPPVGDQLDQLDQDGDQLDQVARPGSSRATRSRGLRSTGWISRRLACDAMLATLAYVLAPRGRAGRVLLARAAAELGGHTGPGELSLVPWDYWLARWPGEKREARRRLARSEIVPLLWPSARLQPETGSPGCPTIDADGPGHTWTPPENAPGQPRAARPGRPPRAAPISRAAPAALVDLEAGPPGGGDRPPASAEPPAARRARLVLMLDPSNPFAPARPRDPGESDEEYQRRLDLVAWARRELEDPNFL